jgi:methylated-DNA-[protein]-cysteine S-methyltransferase
VLIQYHVYSAPHPIGLLFLARTEKGLRYAEYLDRRSIKRVIASHADENPGAEWQASLLALKSVTDQLSAYFHGTLSEFDLPLDPVGSEFQLLVWNALREIPFAATRSYGDIAKAIGEPKATRAVGLANNQNPIVIVIPCHRVIGADGSLVGYGGGLPRKRKLLEHEARFARATVLPGEITETLHVPAVRPPAPRPEPAMAAAPRAKAVAVKAAAPAKPAAKARPPVARAAAKRRAAAAKRKGARPAGSRSAASTASGARRPSGVRATSLARPAARSGARRRT